MNGRDGHTDRLRDKHLLTLYTKNLKEYPFLRFTVKILEPD